MSSTKETAAAANLKAALETFAGHEIDASPQQIEQRIRGLFVPVSTYSFTPQTSSDGSGDNIGHVVSRNIIVFVPPSCATSELLDVSGVAVTSDAGNVTFVLKNFLCPDDSGRFYSEPVNIVATPVSASPVFVTATHTLVFTTDIANDVQISIYTWDANGAPAPGVTVNWRCRVPASIIIL